MASIQEIATALSSITKPGMKPKEIRAGIRVRYPDASKKDIVRAAFYALAESSSGTVEDMVDLHHFALSERGADDAAEVVLKAGARKKKRGREASERSRPI